MVRFAISVFDDRIQTLKLFLSRNLCGSIVLFLPLRLIFQQQNLNHSRWSPWIHSSERDEKGRSKGCNQVTKRTCVSLWLATPTNIMLFCSWWIKTSVSGACSRPENHLQSSKTNYGSGKFIMIQFVVLIKVPIPIKTGATVWHKRMKKESILYNQGRSGLHFRLSLSFEGKGLCFQKPPHIWFTKGKTNELKLPLFFSNCTP